jgi:hypothetical protein
MTSLQQAGRLSSQRNRPVLLTLRPVYILRVLMRGQSVMAFAWGSCWTEIMTDERQIDEVAARYVRAADFRDLAAMAALFTEDAIVEIFTGAVAGWNHWDP